MARVRRIVQNGESWFNENDLRAAINDDLLIEDAAAMLKVSFKDYGNGPIGSLRRAIAYFYARSTGILESN